jgi:hypothetical protein
MKVVINSCYGGFSLSPEATLWLYERGFDCEGFKTPVEEYYGQKNEGLERDLQKWREYLAAKAAKGRGLFLTVFSPDEKFALYARQLPRDHALLLECVETLGIKANGACAALEIVEIPDGVEWSIAEYDGNEWVEEKHRTWGR